MKTTCLALFVSASLTLLSAAATLTFDFGAPGLQTLSPVNNVTGNGTITAALDSAGAATTISLATSGFNGANEVGTQAPTGSMAAAFGVQTTRDSLYGNTGEFNGIFPFATLAFSGLDGSGGTVYSFEFAASRTGVTDNRETRYSVAGLNSGAGSLNASANVSETVVVGGIFPTAGGLISIDVRPGANNNNTPQGFYYLGGLRLVSSPVPEAGSVTLCGVGLLGLLLRRRR